MNEAELVEEYTRIQVSGGSSLVQVAEVDWPLPHSPVLSWETVTVLPDSATDAELHSARKALLGNRRYFRVCRECSKLHLNGHMGERACHGCMERVYHVVF